MRYYVIWKNIVLHINGIGYMSLCFAEYPASSPAKIPLKRKNRRFIFAYHKK